MPAKKCSGLGGLAVLLLLLTPLLCAVESGPAAAQQDGAADAAADPAGPAPSIEEQAFAVTVASWNRRLNQVASYVDDATQNVSETEAHRNTLSTIRAEADRAKTAAEEKIADLSARLEALGPAPGPNDPPESGDVATRRQALNEELSVYRSRATLADLALARARSLDAGLTKSARVQLLDRLTTPYPLPFLPETLEAAAGDLAAVVTGLAETGRAWWQGLPSERRASRLALTIALFIAVSFAVAFVIRRMLRRRFGANPTEAPPPYSQRLLSAVSDGLGQGIIPAAILGVIFYRTRVDESAIHSDFGDGVGLAALLTIIYILATALPHAILSPEYPEWRLTRIPPASARRLVMLIRAIALLFCLDAFLLEVTERVDSLTGLLTPALMSSWGMIFNSLQALCVLALLRPGLWQLEPGPPPGTVSDDAADTDDTTPARTETQADSLDDTDSEEEDRDENEPTSAGSLTDAAEAARAGAGAGFWKLLRFTLALIALIGLLAPFAGYTAVADYLLNNLVWTGLAVGILYVLRGLIREGVGLLFGSAFMRDRLGVEHKTRARMKFWLRVLMDLVMLVAGVLVVAPGWGVSTNELLGWLSEIFAGFTIGNVTISITDVALGLLIFFIALMLTSATKRTLSERVLPQTSMDESVQHSVTAGVGYAGFVVAVALAIAAMGVDLSNIAIIAGALSVGIGFGLQNIVNNFVSGLILLIERPIKAGDWVVVGPNEGFVKQINMRATEIETWQRASIIVPNADLLSSALTNWTHKDKYGRVDVMIGVALDSDMKAVERVMLRAARRHPRTVGWPAPWVLLMEVGASRLEFRLSCYTDDIMWMYFIASELRIDILERFRKAGIVVPYDQNVIHMLRGDPQAPHPDPAQPLGPPKFAQAPKHPPTSDDGAKPPGGEE